MLNIGTYETFQKGVKGCQDVKGFVFVNLLIMANDLPTHPLTIIVLMKE